MGVISIDHTGQRRWNGRTVDEIMTVRSAAYRTYIGSAGMYWEGMVRAGIKEGVWRCAQFNEGQRTDWYEVVFENNTVVGDITVLDPTRPPIAPEVVLKATQGVESQYQQEVTGILLLLETYQTEEDAPQLVPRLRQHGVTNPIMIMKILRAALNISLKEAKDWYYGHYPE